MSEEQNKRPPSGGLADFHLWGKDRDRNWKCKGVFDDAIFQHIKSTQRMFILGGTIFLYRNGYFKPDNSGAMLSSMIRHLIYPEFVKSTTIKRVFDLFLKDDELQAAFTDINLYPAEWVPFRNGFFNPISQTMIPHDPKYRAINQLPWEYHPEEHPEGPFTDAWLHTAFPNPINLETLLQYLGLTANRDMRFQKMLTLLGVGGTGKSTVIRLDETIVGIDNVANVSLQGLSAQFGAYALLGKLLNSCADLEVTALEDTSTLKKLLGQDRIMAEAKYKDPITFQSYAKLIFSTNEMPIVKDERSNGFYRRLLILPMQVIPEKKDPALFDKLEKELPHLIHLCMDALVRLYAAGCITEGRDSIDAVKQLRTDSDTVEAFLEERTEKKTDGKISRNEIYDKYAAFCFHEKRRELNRTGFYRALRAKGIEEKRVATDRYFVGLTFKDSVTKAVTNGEEICHELTIPDTIPVDDEPLPFMK